MEDWKGRVAVVTGANSGIGLGVTKHLLGLGLQVVGIDKDVDTLEKTKITERLDANGGCLHVLKTDLTVDDQVTRAFQWVENNLEGLHLLVNNAGICGHTTLLDGDVSEWKRVTNINLIAYTQCAVEAIALMRKLNIHNGQIINITSNLANYVPKFGVFHFYSATKHAAKAISEGLRLELKQLEVPIRVTSISPGLVKTEIFKTSFGEQMGANIFQGRTFITPEDVAASVQYILSTPPHVTINELAVRPTLSEN